MLMNKLPPMLKDQGVLLSLVQFEIIILARHYEARNWESKTHYSHVVTSRSLLCTSRRVDKFIFPADFIILECKAGKEISIIFGRPFLATGRTIIDVQKGELTMRCADKNEECHAIGFFDSAVEEEFAKSFESLELSNHSFKPPRPSIEDPPTLELKPLSLHLKYAYLGDNNTLSVVISAELTPDQEKKLLEVLKKSKKAPGWTIAKIKRISLAIYMHKILLEDCHGNFIEQ
ncbi:Integrase, catalytic core [Gossypium australe]|uniref:Integrase, catalytic core n=1 Tax=Gossypium australe TaxID=47621 RepID=A0A5B6UTK7_9ROSI|nr:Integrase, catalytic core [Gossypium australe]